MFDELKPEPVVSQETENHTKFHADDGDYEAEYRLDGIKTFENHYSRLAKFNVGTYSYKWGDNEKLRRQDNKAILNAIAGQLDLNTYQHRRAKEEMDRALLSKWSSPNGIDAVLVSVCICAVILRNDQRSSRAYHPNRKDDNNDEMFVKLLERFDYRDKTIRSCFEKVKNHVVWESVDWEQVDAMA